jgi:predicted HicB family RNase H-like nuclease
MGKLVIKSETEKISSINRTIRIKPECFDKLMELAEKHNISFNKVVNQCLEYALENIEE